MKAIDRNNAEHADQPWCPCCAPSQDVRLEPLVAGQIWTCAGCRGELGWEPCFIVGTPDKGKGSPDGEHYHFKRNDGRICDTAQASA